MGEMGGGDENNDIVIILPNNILTAAPQLVPLLVNVWWAEKEKMKKL